MYVIEFALCKALEKSLVRVVSLGVLEFFPLIILNCIIYTIYYYL